MRIPGDQHILQKIQQREVGGYELLFAQYYKSLCMQAYLLVKDKGDPEDIVQEVFIYLWKNSKFEQVHSSLGAYLSTSVRNACLQYLEKTQKLETLDLDYAAHAILPEEHDPEELELKYKEMEMAIAELPEQCRVLFQMVHLEKKKYQEVADLMGISVNTVKTQLRIAMNKLRNAVKEK
jgi:RNA polymerase sigma-70 factor (ECF subfamily)